MKISKTIQDPVLETFVKQLIEAIGQDWEVDPMNPPQVYGYFYHTVVLRDEEIVDETKPSRAEILAKAREAKAAKKAAEAAEAAAATTPSDEPADAADDAPAA